jgi:hypothetical protein
MAEIDINYVTRKEFRIVSVGLAALIITGIIGVLAILKSILLTTPTRSTPIVVRGGSMTAFAESKWTMISASTYCLDINKIGDFYVNFDDMADESSQSWTKPTAVEIHGHDPTGAASTNGLKLSLLAKNCAGVSGHESVQISAQGGGFYTFQLHQHGKHNGNLRFRIDSSAGCTQDEDLCERMSEVLVTDSSGSVSSPIGCADGDCSVEIGIQ